MSKKVCKLGIDGKIISTSLISDQDSQYADGVYDETVALQYLEHLFNWPLWVINDGVRKGRAEVGGKYDQENDVFVCIQPFPSWTFNNETGEWESPIAHPEPDNVESKFLGNEDAGAWQQA